MGTEAGELFSLYQEETTLQIYSYLGMVFHAQSVWGLACFYQLGVPNINQDSPPSEGMKFFYGQDGTREKWTIYII